MILGRLARVPRALVDSVLSGARAAMREHVLGEIDRVLRGVMEPGVESYGFRGPDGEHIEVTPDTMLAMISALRARFRVEL